MKCRQYIGSEKRFKDWLYTFINMPTFLLRFLAWSSFCCLACNGVEGIAIDKSVVSLYLMHLSSAVQQS